MDQEDVPWCILKEKIIILIARIGIRLAGNDQMLGSLVYKIKKKPAEASMPRQGSARQCEETHISKSPNGDPNRKPGNARHFLNQKHCGQVYDAWELLNKKANQQEGKGDSAHSK